MGFHRIPVDPPTYALSPVIPRNARTSRITAAAGTRLAGTFLLHNVMIIFVIKEFYNQKAVVIQVILLDQTFVHCPIFLTAGQIVSLDLVSVPVWLIILSDQLKIVGLISLLNYQQPNLLQIYLKANNIKISHFL